MRVKVCVVGFQTQYFVGSLDHRRNIIGTPRMDFFTKK